MKTPDPVDIERDSSADVDMGEVADVGPEVSLDIGFGSDSTVTGPCALGIPPISLEEGVECDGVDNDCDGFVDEHFTPTLEECGAGSCSDQTLTVCDEGEITSRCRMGEPTGLDDNCDLVDDDCDGRVDESYLGVENSCGSGLCQQSNTQICTVSGLQGECAALEPAPDESDDDCDGIDDDCDGSFDEGYTPYTITCGQGECASDGVSSCSGGVEESSCIPNEPTADHQCDGLDNDCDGDIDEAFAGAPTTCGVGVCGAVGRMTCVRGELVDTCLSGSPLSTLDRCDGLDADCDGSMDEDHVAVATSCGVGLCTRSGALVCQAGQMLDNCEPGSPLDNSEDQTCDLIDDDCDGRIDEAYQGEVVACGVGACSAQGMTICVNGNVQDTCVEGGASGVDDSCDGVDQDCDGLIDEGYESIPMTCGVGFCFSVGETLCDGGQIFNSCQPGEPRADEDESCDNVDSDCDGRFDEGYIPSLVTCGDGVCQGSGLLTCVGGSQQNGCRLTEPSTSDDLCDGLDNDCDGLTDEGHINAETECGTGVCVQQGVLVCTQQGVSIDTCSPLASPPNEFDRACDGIDSDCDGRVDEGYISLQISCGVGACQREGQTDCVDGGVVELCQPGQATADDNCDLIDNDCDASVDEAYITVPISCMEGGCSAEGEIVCTAQGISNTCVIDAREDDPTCDGVDDDCDGALDEDYTPPDITVSCGEGVCTNDEGALGCVGGSVISLCEPLDLAGANDARCDNTDEDCDGVVDEDFSRVEQCGLGVCQVEATLICENGIVSQCTPRESNSDHDICGSRLDDDCDGMINLDYRNLNGPCIIGVGACRAEGRYVCNAQLDGIVCLAVSIAPRAESCDSIDNDCDGIIDERCGKF